MSQHEPLSPPKRTFADALASGQSLTDAAKSASISMSTAKRWKQRPEIQAALNATLARVEEQAEQSAAEIIISKYRAALEPACDTVVEIMSDAEEGGMTRLKAAQMIQDRLAPAKQEPVEQDTLVPRDLLAYMSDEELSTIERIIQAATNKREQAQKDRERLEGRAR